MKTIRLNSEGDSVVELQQLLKNLGYAVNITGTFDKKTDNAVRQFQESENLGADGIVGRNTWLALQSHEESSRGNYKCDVVFASNISEDRRNVVSSESIDLLKKVADSIGQRIITITSTIRFPRAQAITMYDNLEKGNDIRYKPPGEAVKTVYRESKNNGETKEEILDKMIEKIEELSAKNQRVSKHCVSTDEYDTLNVIDVSYRNLDKVKFIKALSKENCVQRIIHDEASLGSIGQKVSYDKNEPCIHLEIEQ